MDQACKDCAIATQIRKDTAQKILDIYHENAKYSALKILCKIESYCRSI